MSKVQKGKDVIEKNQEEGRNECNAAKPSEHEIAIAGAGWRRLNANYEMKSSE
jgi:hypothetical protein